MTLVYMSLFFLLCVAFSLIGLSYTSFNYAVVRSHIYTVILFFGSAVCSLFLLTGGTHNLSLWLNGGIQHYRLLHTVDSLGGLNGMIEKLEMRIRNRGGDDKAWEMLQHLYLFKGDEEAARLAKLHLFRGK